MIYTLQNYKNLIEEKLEILGNSLNNRGNKSADYFKNLSLRCNKLDSIYELSELMNEILLSSGKISDLANFTYNEDMLLEEILENVEEILNKIQIKL